ncbi:Hypothetical protein D9617_9g024560 [Elsinoe fawcettii]|nr:Hypothetical protein D9617_9g024560 [Elsinoe fawcettii]
MSPKAYPHGMPSMFDQFITMPKIEHNANEVLEYQPSRMGSPLAEVDPRQQDSGNDDQDHAEYAEQIHTLCHSLYAEPASHDALGFPVGLTSMLGSSLFSPRKEDWPFRSSSIPLPSLRLDSHLGACISSAQPRGNVSVHCSDDDKEDLFAVYDDNVSINRLGDKTKTSEKLRQDEGLHVDGHPISEHVEASSVDQERQLPKSIPNSSTYPQYMQVSDLVMPVPEVQQVQEGTSPLCNQDDRPYSGASAKSSIPPDPQAQNLAHEHQACVDLKSPAQAPSTTSAERRPSRNSLWAHFVFGSSLPDDESTTAPAFRRTEGNQSADKHLESRPSAPEQDMDALSLAPIVSSSDEALTQPTWQRDHMSTAVQRDRHREKEWSSVWDTQRYKIQSSDDILAGGAATATSSLHTTTDSASAGRDTLSDTPQDSSGTVEPGDSASRLHTQTRSDVVELGSIISPVKVEKQTPRWWRGGTGCGGEEEDVEEYDDEED